MELGLCAQELKSHRKLAKSGGMPGCLHADQHLVQSVVGLARSALHGVNCCWPESDTAVIVRKSSVRGLVQSFSAMVTMLRGVSSLTFLIVPEKDMEGVG